MYYLLRERAHCNYECNAKHFGRAGATPTGTGCGCEATCPVVYFMTVDHKEANTARSITA